MGGIGSQLPPVLLLAIIAFLVVLFVLWLVLPFAVFGIGSRVKEMDKRADIFHARIEEINRSLKDNNKLLKEMNKSLRVLVQQNKITNLIKTAPTVDPKEKKNQFL